MTNSETEQIPALDNVLDMELDANEDRRWLVLYEEDYDDILLDAEDSVALLLDCNQACEVLRLANEIVSALAPAHAPDKEPLEALIEQLQEVTDDD
jgi:hypothetical protein